MFARAGFAEKCVEAVRLDADGRIARHYTIGLDAVLQAVELPAGVAHLDASLANMNADAFSLEKFCF